MQLQTQKTGKKNAEKQDLKETGDAPLMGAGAKIERNMERANAKGKGKMAVGPGYKGAGKSMAMGPQCPDPALCSPTGGLENEYEVEGFELVGNNLSDRMLGIVTANVVGKIHSCLLQIRCDRDLKLGMSGSEQAFMLEKYCDDGVISKEERDRQIQLLVNRITDGKGNVNDAPPVTDASSWARDLGVLGTMESFQAVIRKTLTHGSSRASRTGVDMTQVQGSGAGASGGGRSTLLPIRLVRIP